MITESRNTQCCQLRKVKKELAGLLWGVGVEDYEYQPVGLGASNSVLLSLPSQGQHITDAWLQDTHFYFYLRWIYSQPFAGLAQGGLPQQYNIELKKCNR